MSRRRIRHDRRPPPLAGQRPRRDPRRDGLIDASPPESRVETPSLAETSATTARLRRDPRQGRAARQKDTPSAPPSSPAPPAAAAPAFRAVESPDFWILVVSLHPEPWGGAEGELLGLARQLAAGRGAVALLRLGATGSESGAGPAGADRVIEAGPDRSLSRMDAIRAVMGVFPARHLLFTEDFTGGDLARRLAAQLGERPATGVLALEAGRGGPDRVITRSAGGRQDSFRPLPRILLLDRNRFAPWPGPAAEGRRMALPDLAPAALPSSDLPLADLPPADLPLIETRILSAGDLPLSQADFILSAGEGVTDWPAFHSLSAALGATEAGSRQVCDAGHLPRARQVGASGTLVEARCYLAFGISGAPQHLQGIQKCRHVLAVNTDLHAAMVKRADLAIIADAQAVMPALDRLMAARGSGPEGGA